MLADITPLYGPDGHTGGYVAGCEASDPHHVAIIMGWADGALRYVQKYVPIYSSDAPVLLQLSKYEHFVLSEGRLAQLLQPLVDWLQKRSPTGTSPPLVVHMFSNGGALMFSALELAASRLGLKLNVQGMVVDSAPSEGNLYRLAKMTARFLHPPAFLLHIIAVLVTLVYVLLYLVNRAIGGRSKFQLIWSTLANPAYKCPRVMLYSKADKLVLHTSIEHFMRYAKQQGLDIVGQMWPDSAHVKHYVQYPNEYTSLIKQHVLDPLKKEH